MNSIPRTSAIADVMHLIRSMAVQTRDEYHRTPYGWLGKLTRRHYELSARMTTLCDLTFALSDLSFPPYCSNEQNG